jgi:hypothetical protein
MRNRALVVGLLLLSCGPAQVSSEEAARRAWLGLDRSVGKSITLGFAGFNAASSANIPDQMTTGDDGGTLVISGQVDQGNSANKGMRLKVAMTDYSDGVVSFDGGTVRLAYDTKADALPALTMQLKGIPTGTWSGTLAGTYQMRGDLTGSVTLNLSMSGQLEANGAGVRRKAGATSVTGTATSSSGTYQISLTQ